MPENLSVSVSRRMLGYRRGTTDGYRWSVACLDDVGHLTVVTGLYETEAADLEEQIVSLAKAWGAKRYPNAGPVVATKSADRRE